MCIQVYTHTNTHVHTVPKWSVLGLSGPCHVASWEEPSRTRPLLYKHSLTEPSQPLKWVIPLIVPIEQVRKLRPVHSYPQLGGLFGFESTVTIGRVIWDRQAYEHDRSCVVGCLVLR